jgi:hypothetical protein
MGGDNIILLRRFNLRRVVNAGVTVTFLKPLTIEIVILNFFAVFINFYFLRALNNKPHGIAVWINQVSTL